VVTRLHPSVVQPHLADVGTSRGVVADSEVPAEAIRPLKDHVLHSSPPSGRYSAPGSQPSGWSVYSSVSVPMFQAAQKRSPRGPRVEIFESTSGTWPPCSSSKNRQASRMASSGAYDLTL